MANLGFTGTQGGWMPAQAREVERVVNRLRQEFGWMHNGDCIGSDKLAAMLWKAYGGLIHLHPPDNPSKRSFLTADKLDEPLPYLERNRVIVSSASCLLATPGEMDEQLRSGTWSTVRYARMKGVSIILVYPDGSSFWELPKPKLRAGSLFLSAQKRRKENV
jgi:hypothetical protein